MFGSDPLDELVIPDGTHVREHDLVTDGDVLVGGQSVVELGVRGCGVVAGERVTFGGDIEADGDCRLDMWCEVDGNVLVGDDAYLGERVHITGQLMVSGDLDIGDDVDIEKGFEANGWIVIRNPVPTIVFLFVYLSHLLHIGEEEKAGEVAAEALSGQDGADPARIPRGSRVSDDAWRVSTPATIGDECRLHGNIRATKIDVGRNTEVFGSLRAKGSIRLGTGTVVHGDVTTRGGDVVVAPGVHVRGDISCERCELSETADVDGTIRARDGIVLSTTPEQGGGRGSTATATGAGSDPRSESEGDDIDPRDATHAEDSGEMAVNAGDSDDDPTAAIVPLGEGYFPAPESESDGGSLSEPRERGDQTAAILPIDESKIEWDSISAERESNAPDHDSNSKTDYRSSNGSSDDIAAVIGDAETDRDVDN